MVALRQLASIFQCAVEKKPTSALGVPDTAPPQRPRTRSQTKRLANATFIVPQWDQLYLYKPKPPDDTKKDRELDPDLPDDMPTFTRHHIVPLIPNLRPKYPTKHDGMLEDPFPLIQSANAVTDPDTGKQLEYKQLINHPNSHIRKTWQHSSAWTSSTRSGRPYRRD